MTFEKKRNLKPVERRSQEAVQEDEQRVLDSENSRLRSMNEKLGATGSGGGGYQSAEFYTH